MAKQYIDIPQYTTYNEIVSKDYSFSATQYKTFCIKNSNVIPVSKFLYRNLNRNDLGYEVGSGAYVEKSQYKFIKTKALQPETYLLDINKESVQDIIPSAYIECELNQGDLLISKDSNVGEIAILDRDYPNTMLCGGIYKLPVIKNKYYLLAFIKSEVFRQQIDFLVPRGSTIRHGKTKFLDCLIPMPNKNIENTIQYVEILMKAIISKEIEIQKKHKQILNDILFELKSNQKKNIFQYSYPTYREIISIDRMDSNRFSKEYKEFLFLITNYQNGYSTIYDYGYKVKRGQNLQISNIGKSIYTTKEYKSFYKLVLSQNLSTEGRILDIQYLGNKNKLSVLNDGDIVFSARGQCLGRSFIVFDDMKNYITNIDNMIFYNGKNVQKSIFIHLMLDLYRSNNFIKKIGINGSGAESVTKYQISDIPIPDFPNDKETKITKLYSNSNAIYDSSEYSIDNFLEYDNRFNDIAGIYELDKSMKYLQEKLNNAIDNIANDKEVIIEF